MVIALIVISAVAACGLISLFVCRYVNFVRGGENGEKRKLTAADVKGWFINHVPTKRRLIQVYAMLLYNANIKGFVSGEMYRGNSKYMCVPGLNCYSCPGAVGACPLGAFQNSFAASDKRAPFYMLGIIALFGLICARTICGFLCPIGMCQELLYKVRTPKLKKSRVTRVLSYFKYFILALAIALPIVFSSMLPVPAFCKYICPAGIFEGAVFLLANPNNDGYFVQLGGLFTWKFALLIVFVVAAMFIFRVFCRFICPLGAIYGFFNRFALIGVSVDKESCTDCGLCVSRCKMDVKRVGDHECINCGECMSVCPTKAIIWKGSRIFLRGAACDEPSETVKPIAFADGAAALSGDLGGGIADNTDMTALQAQPVNAASIAADSAEDIRADIHNAAKPPEQKPRKKRGARFWTEFAAWTAAIALLGTALVYYNFIDVEKPSAPGTPGTPGTPSTPGTPDTPGIPDAPGVTVGYKVGDTAPDFTVSLYGEDGEFNLYGNRGKPIVLNFWGTWCGPCVAEMPYFAELSYYHPELTVIALHGSSGDDVWQFIKNKHWNDYPLVFAQDNLDGAKNCLTFRMFGGRDMWPMTVIIDSDGKVLYNSTKSFHEYDDLEKTVLGVVGDGSNDSDA